MSRIVLNSLISKYAHLGLLLDTNNFLLYIVGKHDPDRIEKFKRTNAFKRKDFDLVEQIVAKFSKLVSTPHILTEVSNLSGNLKSPEKTSLFKIFADLIGGIEESSVAAEQISKHVSFPRLGITDCAIQQVAHEQFLVLTDDLDLYVMLTRSGVDVINFNHIRLPGWVS